MCSQTKVTSPSPNNSGTETRVPSVDQRPTAARFTTTLWTEILKAPHNDIALAALCRKYWYPLYAFLRRSGTPPHEAEDLTQGFFLHLMSKQGLQTVRRENGKFRSFLLASLKNFAADQWDRARAAKRFPGQPLLDLDGEKAENRYRLEPVDCMDPEKLFERQWVLTLIEQAFNMLESEYTDEGRKELFYALQPFLGGQQGTLTYRQVATRISMTPGAARVTVHRMRERYRELVRLAIADTLEQGEDVQAEMQYLFQVLRNG